VVFTVGGEEREVTWCILTTSYPKWNEKENEFVQGKFVHDMAKYLVRAGIEVHVVTQHGEGTPSRETRDGVRIHRFHYFPRKWERLTKGSGIPENIKKVPNWIQVPCYFARLFFFASRVIKANSIQVVNAHWAFPTGFIGLLLKRTMRRKLVITMYGAEIFPVLDGNMGYLKRLLAFSIKGADAAAGISRSTVAAGQKASGRKDLHFIPDGIDMVYYGPGDKNLKLLEKYGCEDRAVVYFSGRMVERKGHRFLLEAIAEVKDRIPNVKLLLGGDGPLRDDLVRLRAKLGLEQYVALPGFFPESEIVPLLQSIDLYVLPSCIDKNGDTEGSATAAFEAMSCGTPALVSRVGGNIDSIVEGQGAFYFEPADSRDLAEKIFRVLGNRSLLEKNADLARQFIADNYSWEKTIDRYIAVVR
jgi:glycosyltransferase involved in cell wall biosynthesis